MSRVATWAHTQEYVRIFREQLRELGSAEDAMWIVVRTVAQRIATQNRIAGRRVLDPVTAAMVDASLAEVARQTGVMLAVLKRPSARGKQSEASTVARNARWVAMRVLRDLGLSYSEIGGHLNCHHTTVMYGLGQVAAAPELVTAANHIRADASARRQAA